MKRLLIALMLSAALQAAAPVYEITTPQEYQQLASSKEPVVLFFYAPWCGACKKMKEPFDDVAHELSTKARFVKISIENKRLKPVADNLGVDSIPTIFTQKVGQKLQKTVVGWRTAPALKGELVKALGI